VSTIVTFYSYKGGVGRSMALANIAVLLARRGLRVLTVDWDLEAPGIENYFTYFNVEQERPGLLTMLMDYVVEGSADYRRYLWNVVEGERSFSLLSSGRATDTKYSANLEQFDWPGFFAKGGGEFLETLRDRWREDFDVTLIDSRTGLSDSGGICTIQLPDVVVAMFTANHQSLYGVRDVMRLAQEARHSLAHDRAQLSIVPLASRFGGDFREAKEWLDRTAEAMAEFYRDWLPAWSNPREIAEHLKVPHVDYFGFGEKLAVVEQTTTDPYGMGAAYEKVAGLLAADLRNAEEVFQLRRPRLEAEPLAMRRTPAQARSAEAEYRYDLYVSYDHSAKVEEWLRPFVEFLHSRLHALIGRPVSTFFDYRVLETGSSFPSEVAHALSRSRLLLAVITPRYFHSRWCLAEWKTFEKREQVLGTGALIIPAVARASRPTFLEHRMSMDLSLAFGAQFTQTPRGLVAVDALAQTIAARLRNPIPFADLPVVEPGEVEPEPAWPKPRFIGDS
jgi:MinD-like ATPase involved in chromosome partitioning or flagellar assembly